MSSYYEDKPSIVVCVNGELRVCEYDGRMNRDSWKPMIWCVVVRDERL